MIQKSTATAADIAEALVPLLANQRKRWAARCHAHGVSILGFHVMALLDEHEALPMSQLAEALDVAFPNATGIVNRMEERGLVTRSNDPADRRIVRVSLTDAGHALIGEMEAGRRERMSRLIAELDPEQQGRLLLAVNDLNAASRRLDATEG